VRTIGTLEFEKVENHIFDLVTKGYKKNYINGIIFAYRVYLQFLGDDRYKTLKPFRPDPAPRKVLSDAEIEQIINIPIKSRQNKKTKLRYDTFFSILAYTGCRPIEAAKLHVEDIDFGLGMVTFRDTKTHENRVVPIAPPLQDTLRTYLDQLKGEKLFPSVIAKDGYIEKSTWGYEFNRRLRELGIKRQGVVLYSLRHSFITRLIEEDVNIFKVQRLAGHSQIETTANYVHLATRDLKNAIAKLPLIQKQSDPQEMINHVYDVLKNLDLPPDKFRVKIEMEDGGLKFEIHTLS
jgi:integrase/recombinase XerD